MNCRAAVLVIGSLMWDLKQGREDWRRQHLSVELAKDVRAPILYGKLSRKRNNTYTMVLAPREQAVRWASGTAKLVPFKRDCPDFEGVIDEARGLWRAETGDPKAEGIGNRSWGTIGLLERRPNPANQKRWVDAVEVPKGKPIAVSPDGVLDMVWPVGLEDLDAILVAVNVIDVLEPDPAAVASAWAMNGHENYFYENRRCGIKTAQDDDISRELLLVCRRTIGKDGAVGYA